MRNLRAAASAALLFVGSAGSLGGLGVLVFEETMALVAYLVGITAGSAWLSIGVYSNEVAGPPRDDPAPRP